METIIIFFHIYLFCFIIYLFIYLFTYLFGSFKVSTPLFFLLTNLSTTPTTHKEETVG